MATSLSQRSLPADIVVRCSGCRRTIGWSRSELTLRNAIYCSKWCAAEPPATPAEARNDMWRILKIHGKTPIHISRLYGVAHSLVYRTVAKQ